MQRARIYKIFFLEMHVDACEGHMHASVHLLGFCKILGIFKPIILLYFNCYCVVWPIVDVEAIINSDWGGGIPSPLPSFLCMKPWTISIHEQGTQKTLNSTYHVNKVEAVLICSACASVL